MYLVTNGRLITRDPDGKGYYEHGAVAYEGSKIVPILFMVVLGFIVTVAGLLLMSKRFLKGYWFEQMIGTFGMATGVFITGVLLLRICDPENDTPALASYSLSYTITSVIYFALLNMFIVLPMSSGALVTALVGLGIAVAAQNVRHLKQALLSSHGT